MKNKNINTIISIASVVVMIIWGTLAGTYKHAWLAVFVGGALIACLSAFNKGKTGTETADDAGEGDTVDVAIEPKVASEPETGDSDTIAE